MIADSSRATTRRASRDTCSTCQSDRPTGVPVHPDTATIGGRPHRGRLGRGSALGGAVRGRPDSVSGAGRAGRPRSNPTSKTTFAATSTKKRRPRPARISQEARSGTQATRPRQIGTPIAPYRAQSAAGNCGLLKQRQQHRYQVVPRSPSDASFLLLVRRERRLDRAEQKCWSGR
jgi:hypothetical protein